MTEVKTLVTEAITRQPHSLKSQLSFHISPIYSHNFFVLSFRKIARIYLLMSKEVYTYVLKVLYFTDTQTKEKDRYKIYDTLWA